MRVVHMRSFAFLLAALLAGAQGEGACPAKPTTPSSSFALQALERVLEDVPGAECRRQVAVFLEGLHNITDWALMLADATAKVPAGLLRGNLRALGDVDECVAVEAEVEAGAETVRGKYCLASVHVDSDSAPVARLLDIAMGDRRHLEFRHRLVDVGNGALEPAPGYTPEFTRGEVGVCVPAACAAADVEAALRGVARRLEGVTALRFDVRVAEQDCQTSDGRLRPLGAAHYAFVGFCSVFVGLLILGTIWDVHFDNKLVDDKGAGAAVLKAFSLRTSWQRLTSECGGELGCIAGLQALFTPSVILLHELLYSTREPVFNRIFLVEAFSSANYTYFVTSWIVVDGYFTISGTLYSYAMADKIIAGRFNYAATLLHRYIRLTPVYYIILWFYATFLEYLGNGPGWDTHINYNVKICRKNWIFNAFYVNNYINTTRMCMGQSWFLATDMQFFMLAPLVLVPLYRWRRGRALAVAVIMVSVAVAASAVVLTGTPAVYRIHNTDEQIVQFIAGNHVKSHMHSSSYLVGLYLGYILHRFKDKKVHMSKTLVVFGWTVCASIFAVASFGPHYMLQKNYGHSLMDDAAYSAISRLLWGIAVAWIIFACHTGYGGLYNRFLNCYAFRVLSRISYSTNMVHFILLLHNSGRRMAPIWLDELGYVQMFLGDYGISLVIGLIVFLIFESPIYFLWRIKLLKGLNKDSSTSSVHKIDKIK